MLPESASPASILRFDLARALAASCPPFLADEIAVSGSVARGWSDDDSDLELNLWVKTLPPRPVQITWLESAGVTDLQPEPAPRSDDSWWIAGTLQGVPIEVGWQTYAALDSVCDRLLSGTVTDRGFTFLADLLIHVILLRDTGTVSARLAPLRTMPERVQRALIAAAAARFTPGCRAASLRLAQRGETLALNERLLADLDAAVQIMYAAHKRWLPGRKWTLTAARSFVPPAWLTRFDAALTTADPVARLDAVLSLVKSALAEVPCDIDVYGILSHLD